MYLSDALIICNFELAFVTSMPWICLEKTHKLILTNTSVLILVVPA